jgi:hypothetical protein
VNFQVSRAPLSEINLSETNGLASSGSRRKATISTDYHVSASEDDRAKVRDGLANYETQEG